MKTLVLLPGMDGTGDLFAPLAHELGSLDPSLDVAIARYPTDEALTYSQLQTVARAACPANGQYFLLGESFSGPLAIRIAATQPAGLRGIILCATFASNPSKLLGSLGSWGTKLPLGLAPSPLISWALLGRFADRPRRQALIAAVRSVGTHTYQTRLNEVLKVNVLADLATIRVPILYLRASEDALVSKSSMTQICGAHPAVEVIEVKGPHCLLQAAPQQAAAAISRFMAKTLKAQ